MSESTIQSKIIHYLKSKKIYIIKTIVTNRNGIPDIICCYKGRFIGFEVKTEKKKPTELQNLNIKLIWEAGGEAYVVRCLNDVVKVIENQN